MNVSMKVNLDHAKIQTFLQDEQYDELCELLDSAFKIQSDPLSLEPKKFRYEDKVAAELCSLLVNLKEKKIPGSQGAKVFNSIFKGLRNYTLSETAQKALLNHEDLMEITQTLLHFFLDNQEETKEYSPTIRLILQFLSNLTIYGTPRSKALDIIDRYLVQCLKSTNFQYITLALIYNTIREENIDLRDYDETIFELLLDIYGEKPDEIDYLRFIMEVLLKNPEFCEDYLEFKTEQRLNILQVLYNSLLNKNFTFNEKLLEVLPAQFKKQADCIFKTTTSNFQEKEALEVSYLIDVIAVMSSHEDILPKLQENNNLLVVAASLLQGIHAVGKETQNYFTPIEKLSQVARPSDKLRDHPAYSIKVSLIRLLGNLCYKNKKNQDQIREMEIIPVILDCSKIDARNPLIIQWVVLAIRNLCENNTENQKAIASSTMITTVNSAILKEMGLTLHRTESNEITAVPLEELKKNENK